MEMERHTYRKNILTCWKHESFKWVSPLKVSGYDWLTDWHSIVVIILLLVYSYLIILCHMCFSFPSYHAYMYEHLCCWCLREEKITLFTINWRNKAKSMNARRNFLTRTAAKTNSFISLFPYSQDFPHFSVICVWLWKSFSLLCTYIHAVHKTYTIVYTCDVMYVMCSYMW